ncbi:MAG: hypothetical protein WA739_21230, partial [Candidatus Acidiferrales bacterium]
HGLAALCAAGHCPARRSTATHCCSFCTDEIDPGKVMQGGAEQSEALQGSALCSFEKEENESEN